MQQAADALAAAIGSGDQGARATLDNELVAATTAWRTGQVVYLPAADFYIAAGGASATVRVLDAITAGKHDAVFGGGRRDEERARAKERIFSMRDEFGQWDPRNQRPELWSLYNGRHLPGEHVRVFPLSNWTELDVWDYIESEKIALPTIYYAHEREVALRDGMWVAITPVTPVRDGEEVTRRSVRYRTVGDMSCTAAVLSSAGTVADVITEVGLSSLTERGATRADDRMSEAAMEDRKREGYF